MMSKGNEEYGGKKVTRTKAKQEAKNMVIGMGKEVRLGEELARDTQQGFGGIQG